MEILFEKVATPEDLEQIKCWHEDRNLLNIACMRDDPPSEEEYTTYFFTHTYLVYVDGLAIGYARLFKSMTPNEGELCIVIALEEYRNQGLGKEIGKRLIEAAKTIGLTKLYWATSDTNLESIKLAKRLGFSLHKIMPELLEYGGRRHDAIIYAKEEL